MQDLRKITGRLTTEKVVQEFDLNAGNIQKGDIIGITKGEEKSIYFVHGLNEAVITLELIAVNNSPSLPCRPTFLSADEFKDMDVDLIFTVGDIITNWNLQIHHAKDKD